MLFGQTTEESTGYASDRRRMATLFTSALVIRILYLIESRASNPFFDAPVVDAQSYLELARRIVGGDWLGGSAPFWQPPAFPYLLALILGLFGDDNIFAAVRVAHAVLGAGSTLLIYRLARRPFGASTATLAAVGTALYGPLLYFEGELLSVALEVFLYLTLLLMIVRAAELDRVPDWALAGLLAGAAAITRPNVLLFVVLVALVRVVRTAAHQRRRAIGRLLVAAATLAAVVAPVTLRNAAVGGEFVLVSANGGVNFHIGNHARQDSMVAIHPGVFWERLVAEPLAAGYSAAGQRSRYFYQRGFASIVGDPFGWLQLMGRKSWQLIQGPEIKRNQDVYYARVHSLLLSALLWDRWLSFPHGLVAPLALLGLALTWRRREPTLDLLRLFLAGYAGSVLLFFVTSRYRVPLVPVAMIFGAIALQELAARARAGGRRLVVPAGALLLLIVAVNVQSAPPSVEQDAQLQHDLGEVLLRKERFTTSAQHSRRALTLEPEYPSAWHNLAVARLALDLPVQAESAARRALALHPLRADTRIALARALLSQGRGDEALEELETAARQEPDDGDVRYGVGRLLLQTGLTDAALEHLEAAARLRPGRYWVHYDLGRALHARGRAQAAMTVFERAVRLEPERVDALSAAGAVALSSGDLSRARDYLVRAMAADVDYLPARINMGLLEVGAQRYDVGIELLEAVIDRATDPAPLWSALAGAYRATGQIQKARAAMAAARAR
jgi:tetratricopeptide (TPR) repeat protein